MEDEKKRAGVRKKGKMKGVDGEDKGVGEERRGEEREEERGRNKSIAGCLSRYEDVWS